MKKIITLTLIASSFLVSCEKTEKTLKIYGWRGYIDRELTERFENETGIVVEFEEFNSNEVMYKEISEESKYFDLIIPTDYIIERFISENKLQKIDYALLPNYDNILQGLQSLSFDEKGEYYVPYMWGSIGIAYNSELVEKPESWDVLFDEQYKNQILVYDSPREIISYGLKKLNYSLNTTSLYELEDARDVLISQRPLIKGYVGPEIVEMMVNEEAAFAIAYSGDVVNMHIQNEDIKYVIPLEGSNVWIDAFVIPKNAVSVKSAHMFIDFMNRPENAKFITEKTGFTTANEKALEIIDPKLLETEGYYPFIDSHVMEIYRDLDKNTTLVIDEFYREILNK